MSLEPEIRDQIKSIVDSGPVVLFMKGNAMQPQCGFSARVVDILNRLMPSYVTFDVLSDPEVREGIKEYSDWPTIPQLYVNGEFQGGCDIVTEMYDKGELHQALGVPVPEVGSVSIEISDAAAEILRQAQARFPADALLHIGVDAAFRHSLGFGPREGGEVEVEAAGFTVLLDRESAARADGLSLDVVAGPGGEGRLSIDNPNAPSEQSGDGEHQAASEG